jgi:hypothetical protein
MRKCVKGSLDKGSLDKGSLDKGSLDKGSLDKGSLDILVLGYLVPRSKEPFTPLDIKNADYILKTIYLKLYTY